jgi:hypothetical protein
MYILTLKLRVKNYAQNPVGKGWIGLGERVDIPDSPQVLFYCSDEEKEVHPVGDIVCVSHLPEENNAVPS